jgi:predicted dienelactone hydrolase
MFLVFILGEILMKNVKFVNIVLVVLLVLLAGSGLAQNAETLPLAERGPYFVGKQTLVFTDSNRSGRVFATNIVYPAHKPDNFSADQENLVNADVWIEGLSLLNAEPDDSDAPYPLILFSHWWSSNSLTDIKLFTHLASHGFVVASIEHECDHSPTCLIDRPMDVLFVLDQLDEFNEDDLAEIIDTDQVGVMGISFGGYTTLATAGARIDPTHFLTWAANDDIKRNPWDNYLKYTVAAQWDEVASYRAQFDILKEGASWPSVTNGRIHAVMPIVPSLGMVFGEHGVEAVAVPTLMLAATKDDLVPYKKQIVPMYAQLSGEERYLISFIGYGHLPQNLHQGEVYFKHFSTAFFGYYLQEQETYIEYLTETYVNNFEDLAWGVYEGE